jgi:hypothetical protein
MAHGERGREQDVEEKLVSVALTMVDLLEKRGFKVSSKTVVATTPAALGERVVARLAKAGVHFNSTQVARDLGIDTYGVRRGTKVMQSRLRKAGQCAKGIRSLLAVNKDTKSLVNTGFRPQAIWGMEAQGLSPSALRRLRSLVAGMSGAKQSGGCATLAIRMVFYRGR